LIGAHWSCQTKLGTNKVNLLFFHGPESRQSCYGKMAVFTLMSLWQVEKTNKSANKCNYFPLRPQVRTSTRLDTEWTHSASVRLKRAKHYKQRVLNPDSTNTLWLKIQATSLQLLTEIPKSRGTNGTHYLQPYSNVNNIFGYQLCCKCPPHRPPHMGHQANQRWPELLGGKTSAIIIIPGKDR
jgi:hypothetical protein